MIEFEENLPDSIGKPALRALNNEGIRNLKDVSNLSDSQLLALHGVGPKAIRILREYINSIGSE